MTLRYSVSEPSALRAELIDAGMLRPGPADGLRRVRLPEGTKVLRLDAQARRAAARHRAEGPMDCTPDDQIPRCQRAR